MNPALERLTQSVNHYERGEAIWDVKLARDKLADAAPALIAAMVEIKGLIKRHHLESGSVSDWDDGYSQALKNIQAITHKHLEPLK